MALRKPGVCVHAVLSPSLRTISGTPETHFPGSLQGLRLLIYMRDFGLGGRGDGGGGGGLDVS